MKRLNKRNRNFLDAAGDMINRCACKYYNCGCSPGDWFGHTIAKEDIFEFSYRVAIKGIEPMSNKG